MPATRRWRMHPAADKEFKSLPQNGKQGLADLMGRLRRGDQLLPREVEHYGNGIRALKYSEAGNEFRCYYCLQGEQSQVLLGVEFLVKKTRKADLTTATKRRDEWEAEHRQRTKKRSRDSR